jgi:hypothetical protein
MNVNLSQYIDPKAYTDIDELFEYTYTIFQLEINDRKSRPTLFNKFIYIDGNYNYGTEKIDIFWHISSIGAEDTKFDMYPCLNDIANSICKYLCNVDHCENILKEHNSVPCIFRTCRIKWIKQIIELVNKNPKHENIRIWKQKNRRTGENNLLIRYTRGHIDYAMVFKINVKEKEVNYYRFITAYPVVLKSYKRRFDREYEEYILKKY